MSINPPSNIFITPSHFLDHVKLFTQQYKRIHSNFPSIIQKYDLGV